MSAMDPSRPRILVVDDEKVLRSLMRRVLEREGYRVDEAPSSNEAMALLHQNEYSLALVDIHLGSPQIPEDVDGLELCRRIRSDPAIQGIGIIVITVFGDRAHVVASTRAGANDFIVKPFEAPVLEDRVRRVLGQRLLAAQRRAESDAADRARESTKTVEVASHAQARAAANRTAARRGSGLAARRSLESKNPGKET